MPKKKPNAPAKKPEASPPNVPVGRPAFRPEHTNEARATVFLKPSEPPRTPVHLDVKGRSSVQPGTAKSASVKKSTTDTRG